MLGVQLDPHTLVHFDEVNILLIRCLDTHLKHVLDVGWGSPQAYKEVVEGSCQHGCVEEGEEEPCPPCQEVTWEGEMGSWGHPLLMEYVVPNKLSKFSNFRIFASRKFEFLNFKF